MKLVKTHGSLNEIFALEASPRDWESAADLHAFVRAVCDRDAWTGGGDGIYLYDASAPRAQAWFFNPDASASEFCGNGMRGLGRLILDRRGTDAEVVTTGGRDYTVRRASSTPEGVRQVLLELPPLTFGTGPLPDPFTGFTAVRVPNPHVIALVTEYSEPELIKLGRRADEVFAEGANVSFLRPLTEGEVFVRTFERGAGLTPACGSGVVASRAAYSRLTGTDPAQRLVVRNAGGVATASIAIRDAAWYPTLEGNATIIYQVDVDPAGQQTSPIQYAADENAAYATLDTLNTTYLKEHGITTAHS